MFQLNRRAALAPGGARGFDRRRDVALASICDLHQFGMLSDRASRHSHGMARSFGLLGGAVELLRGLKIAIQFGHVPLIIEGERIVGVELIGLREILHGIGPIVPIQRSNAVQV